MDMSPECQAQSLGPGRSIAARLIQRGPEAPAQPRYHHFHPAAEILWFRSADAVMHTRGRACPTGTGDLVYLPSMTPHDFDVARGNVAFVLLLYDPAQEQRLPPALQSRLTRGPLVLRTDPAQAKRLETLTEWLIEATETGGADSPRMAATLLDLVLTILAQEGEPVAAVPGQPAPRRDPLARLERAIALIHAEPARPLSLGEAAAACHLSPAYFARLFRARMGETFADYVQRHRLNLAARLAASSDLGIAEIAWRTGFGSPAHLSTRFAQHFGLSPTRYREAARRYGPFPSGPKGQGQTSLSPD
jgi:AraC-like DNA-binding protein